MDGVQDATPGAEQSVYVDDISQVSRVPLVMLLMLSSLEVRIKFSQAIAGLHLRVSPKSVIIASSIKLSKWIHSELSQSGIGVQVARTARDLGVCRNPGKRGLLLVFRLRGLFLPKVGFLELPVLLGSLGRLGSFLPLGLSPKLFGGMFLRVLPRLWSIAFVLVLLLPPGFVRVAGVGLLRLLWPSGKTLILP